MGGVQPVSYRDTGGDFFIYCSKKHAVWSFYGSYRSIREKTVMDGYGNGNNNMNSYDNGGGYGNPIPPYGNHPKFATMLTLSILMTCCCNTVPGVVAIVLTCVANSSYKQGMMVDADSKMRGASIALIVGLGLFALSMIFLIFYFILLTLGLVASFA